MNAIDIFTSIAVALSLCADCFAVTSCSSVTLERISWRKILTIAFIFGVIQTLLMWLGWLFGDVFVGIVEKAASIIGFLLLLYVGGSMILEAVKGGSDQRNLNGIWNVMIGGLATSIDAFAVGISMSMDYCSSDKAAVNLTALFVVTVLSVVAGISGGSAIGRRFGKGAEITGGCVLILIGLNVLFGFI